MKTIFHYNASSRNYGDMTVQHGIAFSLSAISKESLNFISIDLKAGNPLTIDDIYYMNSFGHALIVGGGGLIMKGDGFDTESGWQFNIDIELLKHIRIPIIIYAIGLNEFPYDTGFPEKIYDHLRETMRIAKLVSVRNSGTRKFLKDIEVFKKIDVIPDPAMFVERFDLSLPFPNDDYLIGINWAGDRIKQRYKNTNKFDDIQKIAKACQRFLEFKGGGKVVWIPHVAVYDIHDAHVFRDILKEAFFDISELYPHLYPEQYFYVPQILGIYKRMNMVIAMRGHGNIFSFGQGTRCIAYGDHKKVEFFSREVSTPCLKTSCTEYELYNCMVSLESNQEYVNIVKLRRKDLYQDLLNFNVRILKLIGAL